MRIKLAILEKDQSYLNRIVTAFSTKYADKFEIYSFTDQAIALATLDSNRIDVLVASDVFEIDTTALPKRCGFAYFVDSADVETVNDERAICKFQKADTIYRQILSVYSENAGTVSGIRQDGDGTKIIFFASPCGGVGTSTLAAACAIHFSQNKKKTLYLNLEKFGSADSFFEAEGNFNMSDIIYAIKSKKANLGMKLESCVKQDKSGVFYFSQSKIALDMHELNCDDIERLLYELKSQGAYDYIIADMEFSMTADVMGIMKQAHALVWVGDGTEISNLKIQRAYNALIVKEENDEISLANRMSLIYSKFSNKSSKTVEDIGLKIIGGAPVYTHATTKQIVNQISSMNIFDNIM